MISVSKIHLLSIFCSQIIQAGLPAQGILLKMHILEQHRSTGIFPLHSIIASHITSIKEIGLGRFQDSPRYIAMKGTYQKDNIERLQNIEVFGNCIWRGLQVSGQRGDGKRRAYPPS